MPRVVARHAFQSLGRLADRRPRHETGEVGRNAHVEACVLDDARPAGGKEADAPVAEPAGAQPDQLVLFDRELALRLPEVATVVLGAAGHRVRIAQPPAVTLQALADGLFLDPHGELERLAGAGGKIEDALEVRVLRPEEGPPVDDDVLPAVAIGANGTPGSARRRGRVPEGDDHWRVGLAPVDAARGDRAIRFPDPPPVSEKDVVSLEEGTRSRVAVCQLHLFEARVGLHVDQTALRSLSGVGQRRAAEIHDQVRALEALAGARLVHAVPRLAQAIVIGPGLPEVEAAEGLAQEA